MNARAINRKDYGKLLELDKKVYPTSNPVTPKILDSWYQKNPEFGIIFEENNKIIGMCIAIPLNKLGWEKLINGKLAESELDEKTIFDNSRDKEIGIHIYHIEKFMQEREFYKKALEQISAIISKLRKTNPHLKIIGFSGLCVTKEGINLFHKFNCKERDYIIKEHIFEKNGNKFLLENGNEESIKKKISEGYNYENRCKMLVLYPDEKSVVWDYLN